MKKRIVSLFLAILMVLTLLPITAFALRTTVEITDQTKDMTVHPGTKLTLSVSTDADLGEGEYLYYLWFDPDMVPAQEIVDVLLDIEKDGVIKTKSIVSMNPFTNKVGELVSIYNKHKSMFDGIFDAMMAPNLSTHTLNITANETRRYQCLAYVNNVEDIQELADALKAVDRSNLVESVKTMSPIMDSEIYGYALSEPITVTVSGDHEYDFAAVVTAPTCTEKGYTTYTCSCGYSYVDNYVDALGHDFGEWQVTTEPSCTAKGVETRYCSRCEATETRDIAALGHDYVNGECTRCHETALLFTKQPTDLTAASGTTGKFSVTAEGDDLTYQWQYLSTGSSAWTNSTAASAKKATFSVSVRSKIDGYKYRCIVIDSNGNTVTSDEATLSVTAAITKQPTALKAASGTTGKFSVTADGVDLTYQWQYQTKDSSTWTNSAASSAKKATFSVSAREKINGYKYRCIVKDAYGNSVTSSAVALTVTPNITKQPANLRAKSGTTGKISITASGDGLKYQWQYQAPGGKWTNASATSAKTATLSLNVRSSINGYKYRCKVTNSCGNSVTSSAVTLTVTPAIKKQPTSLKAASGTTAKFSVTADGVDLSYQWQYQTKSSKTWTNATANSAKTATLSVNVRSSINGYKYRCVIKDSAGNSITSSTATLTVK